MTERQHLKEMHKIAERLEMILRDNENHKRWLEASLAYVRACARVSTGAHEGNGAKEETKKESFPHTPYKEKNKEENLGKDRLIDTPQPSADASGNQSIDPLLADSVRDCQLVLRGSLEPAEQEVVTIATTALGVPGWYATWWHRYMVAADWVTNRGERVDRRNWRPLLMTWWRNCREDERETIRREVEVPRRPAETAEQMRSRLLAEQERLFGRGE